MRDYSALHLVLAGLFWLAVLAAVLRVAFKDAARADDADVTDG